MIAWPGLMASGPQDSHDDSHGDSAVLAALSEAGDLVIEGGLTALGAFAGWRLGGLRGACIGTTLGVGAGHVTVDLLHQRPVDWEGAAASAGFAGAVAALALVPESILVPGALGRALSSLAATSTTLTKMGLPAEGAGAAAALERRLVDAASKAHGEVWEFNEAMARKLLPMWRSQSQNLQSLNDEDAIAYVLLQARDMIAAHASRAAIAARGAALAEAAVESVAGFFKVSTLAEMASVAMHGAVHHRAPPTEPDAREVRPAVVTSAHSSR